MQLNKWLGSDKPKKDDFNYDNQQLDDAYRILSQSVEQLEAGQLDNSYASEQALAAHTNNTDVHVTSAEKAAWSQGGVDLSIGSYTGTGDPYLNITLGYQPKFVLIFAAGEGISSVSWTNTLHQTYCGCLSQLGCSRGLSLNSDGFTVTHSTMGTTDGFCVKFNALNVKYIYLIWR